MGFASDQHRIDFMEGYDEGYDSGYDAGYKKAMSEQTGRAVTGMRNRAQSSRVTKRKRSRSPVQKLLDDMAGKAWKSYKRNSPNGKKSYMDIRSRVSRSQDYKKKAKRLKK